MRVKSIPPLRLQQHHLPPPNPIPIPPRIIKLTPTPLNMFPLPPLPLLLPLRLRPLLPFFPGQPLRNGLVRFLLFINGYLNRAWWWRRKGTLSSPISILTLTFPPPPSLASHPARHKKERGKGNVRKHDHPLNTSA
jgi:hypothetical protein